MLFLVHILGNKETSTIIYIFISLEGGNEVASMSIDVLRIHYI